MINNRIIPLKYNESGHQRGLHIVIINNISGHIEMQEIFDTYKFSNGFDRFIANPIPEGYIIVAACKDECVSALS